MSPVVAGAGGGLVAAASPEGAAPAAGETTAAMPDWPGGEAWPSGNTGTESPVRRRCDMSEAMSQRREGLLGLLKHLVALLGGLPVTLA